MREKEVKAMDEVLKIVKERRSIRNFRNTPIPADIVAKLSDALIWAPSAGNLQSRKFYFVTDENLRKQIAIAALNQEFIAEAPLVIVGCADDRISQKYGERGMYLYAIQDVACSIMNMMLVAEENGIGTVWVGAFLEYNIHQILNLPLNLKPVVVCPVGYPAVIPAPPERVSVSEAIERR